MADYRDELESRLRGMEKRIDALAAKAAPAPKTPRKSLVCHIGSDSDDPPLPRACFWLALVLLAGLTGGLITGGIVFGKTHDLLTSQLIGGGAGCLGGLIAGIWAIL